MRGKFKVSYIFSILCSILLVFSMIGPTVTFAADDSRAKTIKLVRNGENRVINNLQLIIHEEKQNGSSEQIYFQFNNNDEVLELSESERLKIDSQANYQVSLRIWYSEWPTDYISVNYQYIDQQVLTGSDLLSIETMEIPPKDQLKLTTFYVDPGTDLVDSISILVGDTRLYEQVKFSQIFNESFKLFMRNDQTFPVSFEFTGTDQENQSYTISDTLDKSKSTIKLNDYIQDHSMFQDVTKHWAKDFILSLASKGLVSGKSTKIFAPDDSITRAEFASILSRMLNLPVQAHQGTFSDIPASLSWAQADIEAAYRAGIILGYNGKFNPNDKITRQDMAAMIVRAVEYKDSSILKDTSTNMNYVDAGLISDYAKEHVRIVTALGIASGKMVDGKHVFAPKEDATRAEAATMLYKLLGIVSK